MVSSSQIVRQTIAQLEKKGQLVNLSPEAVELLASGLCSALTKLENKSTMRSKTIHFAYLLNHLEVTHRCMRLMTAIFKMNWESIREKEKTSKKMIESFTSWLLFWSLLGVVFV